MKKQRLILKQSQKNKLALRVAGTSIFLLLMGFFVYFQIGNNEEVHAAANGDYRSKATGSWATTGTWQMYNGSAWVNATAAPTKANGEITIQSGHNVTVGANVDVDQVIIASGGTITVSATRTLTVSNGTGNDLEVNGTLTNSGTINPTGNIVVNSGGRYQHSYTTTNGTIPTATWNSGSICEIKSYTSNTTAPNNFNQAYHHFIWNCTGQTAAVNLANNLTSVAGNFTLTSSGSSQLILTNNNTTFNCAGDFTVTAGTLVFNNSNSSTPTLNITGNYSQTGGTFTVVNGTSSTGTVNLTGNWSHTGGTINVGGVATASGLFVFNKSGIQTFAASGNTVSGNVDTRVAATSTLSMGTNIVKGRNFTLISGGTLNIGHSAGITSSGSTGNIQVSGTRTFPTTSNYIYSGSSSQVTGNGLPATVNDLTINKTANLTLSSSVAVSNILTLTNGDIVTSSNELSVTNTATNAIQGYSTSSYVNGNLRRSVNGSGTYAYPLGSSSDYELASITLNSATGFTTILGLFNNSNPINSSLPLRGIYMNKFTMNKMLDHGYWTFTPNSAMTGGTYDIELKERGHSKSATYPNLYCILKRTNSSARWTSVGTHDSNTQTESGGTVTAVRTGLTSFSDFAIAYGVGFMTFISDSLRSGTAGQVGAVYLFPDVSDDIDAWIEILSLDGGATLSDIDDFSGGYDDAWQPFINVPNNATSSILWKITFKKADTTTDTTLADLSLMAVDVDGNNSNLQEYVETNDLTTYSIDPSCNLNITLNSGTINATSPIAQINNIDTTKLQAMFQIDKRNVRTITYRTGAISTSSSSTTRQNCLFFKPFFTTPISLPVKLMSFTAKLTIENTVSVNWATASETNNDFFIVERSSNGESFTPIGKIDGHGNSSEVLRYSFIDRNPLPGKSYYRLKQVDYDGKSETFEPTVVSNSAKAVAANNLQVSPNPFKDTFTVTFNSTEQDVVDIILYSINGTQVYSEQMQAQIGFNSFEYQNNGELSNGTYIIKIAGKTTNLGSSKIIKY